MGLGEIGLIPTVFWRLTLWEWMRAVAGYRKRQNEFWRMNRQLACLTYNINVDKKDRVTPEEYMPLPGDNQKPQKSNTGFMPPEIFIEMLNGTFGNLSDN